MTEPIQKLLLALDKLPKVKKFEVSSADNATPFIVIEIMQAVRDAKDGIAHLARFGERWCEEADRRDPTTQAPTVEDASLPSTPQPIPLETVQSTRIQEAILSMAGIGAETGHARDTSGKPASSAAKASVSPARRKRKPRTMRSSSRAEAPRTKEGPSVLPPPPRATPENGTA